MMLCDFHIHSNFSDGSLSIPEIVDLYGRQGFKAIAITDHLCESTSLVGKAAAYLGYSLTPTTFPLYQEILKSEAERAKKQYGMLLIPGVELTKNSMSNHRSAHILGLGVTKPISADGDIQTIVGRIHEQGGIAIAAHPVWTRKFEPQTYFLWDKREELSKTFDAWEVASGSHIFKEVWTSCLPMIANSDLHKPSQINSWKTVLSCELNQQAIFSAIKKQEVDFRLWGG